jgi:Ca-activated chloride channel family protein
MSRNRKSVTRRGGILPMIAIMLPVTLGIAAFAMNIAYFELNRTEMMIAADAAARASGREFALKWDQKKAIAAGKSAAARNPIGGKTLVLEDTDFVFGEATRASAQSRYVFKKGGANPNAVELDVRRVASSSGGGLSMLVPFAGFSNDVDAVFSSRTNQTEADIAVVIDRSGSMAYASNEKAVYPPLPKNAPADWWFGNAAPTPSRWRDLTSSVSLFLDEMNKTPMKETVSLVTYSDASGVDVGLTTDYKKINDGLKKYTDAFTGGSTNIAGGLASGQAVLTGKDARVFTSKILVLMTDGIDTTKSDLVKAAKDVADKKIMIFTVTFSDEADQSTMKKVAEIGMGKHYHATTASDLQKIFLEISREIPVLITK